MRAGQGGHLSVHPSICECVARTLLNMNLFDYNPVSRGMHPHPRTLPPTCLFPYFLVYRGIGHDRMAPSVRSGLVWYPDVLAFPDPTGFPAGPDGPSGPVGPTHVPSFPPGPPSHLIPAPSPLLFRLPLPHLLAAHVFTFSRQ